MMKLLWMRLLGLMLVPLAAFPQERFLSELSTVLPGSMPEEIAQSVIIFVPTVDTPLISTKDVYLKGKITHVERGEVPGAIVIPADTLWGVRAAGVPVRMYLMRYPGRDAYYPIFSTPVTNDTIAGEMRAVPAPHTNAVDISVSISSPLGEPVNAAPLDGVPYAFNATLRSLADAPQRRADLYFGITRPDGNETFTWVNGTGAAYLRRGMAPLVEEIAPGAGTTLDVAAQLRRQFEYSFTGHEAPGMYTVFALLVLAGTSPANSANWLGVDMAPLVVE